MQPNPDIPAGPALLIDGSGSRFFAGILGGDGNWLAFQTATEPALESLFKTVEKALQNADLELSDLRAFIYCEGPGSILGLRLCAMAIQTWNRLQENPAPIYAYNSLQLAGADLIDRGALTGEALLISDWKKDTWNGLRLKDGAFEGVAPVHSDELPKWKGRLYHLPARKGWQSPPEDTVEVSYNPKRLPELLTVGQLLRATDDIELYQSGLNTFQKWRPDRHRGTSPDRSSEDQVAHPTRDRRAPIK